jgi:alkyl-hydroperoxide reductase/thiol specific antioxidant family protein
VWGRRAQLGARVVCVSFARAQLLDAYRRELGIEVELYSDPELAAYRAFGFGRASVARAWLHPRVWMRYGQLLARGWRLRPPREDTLQLGGDVVSGADGRVRWVYRSAGPEDRPSLALLTAAVAG